MRLPLPRPVCLLLYSCLVLPFFSHIADLPGLACLNHLSTGVKSKCSPSVCAQLHNSCWCEAKESGERFGEEGHGEAGGGSYQWLLARPPVGTRMCTAGSTVTNGVFFFFFKFRTPRQQPRGVAPDAAVPRSASGTSVGFGLASRGCLWLHPQFLKTICNILTLKFLLLLREKKNCIQTFLSRIYFVVDFSYPTTRVRVTSKMF